MIRKQDVLAKRILEDYRLLEVLDRMDIPLGLGNKTIAAVAQEQLVDADALVLIINMFSDVTYSATVGEEFHFIPPLLQFLEKSHKTFLGKKIPSIQQNIQTLRHKIQDAKSVMVERFYNNYIEEVSEHIAYENKTVFPYIKTLYRAYLNDGQGIEAAKDYGIKIYGEHHDDIEDVLKDLKNILIRHLPQQPEEGQLRRIVLEQLFELESDLYSHTRIEEEVLIPLVKALEIKLLVGK